MKTKGKREKLVPGDGYSRVQKWLRERIAEALLFRYMLIPKRILCLRARNKYFNFSSIWFSAIYIKTKVKFLRYSKRRPFKNIHKFRAFTFNVGWNLAIAAKEWEKLLLPKNSNVCMKTLIWKKWICWVILKFWSTSLKLRQVKSFYTKKNFIFTLDSFFLLSGSIIGISSRICIHSSWDALALMAPSNFCATAWAIGDTPGSAILQTLVIWEEKWRN